MHRLYICTILFYIGDVSVQGLSGLFVEARHGGTCKFYFCMCVCGVHVCLQVSLYGGGGCACVCLMEVNTGCLSIALHFNLRQGF